MYKNDLAFSNLEQLICYKKTTRPNQTKSFIGINQIHHSSRMWHRVGLTWVLYQELSENSLISHAVWCFHNALPFCSCFHLSWHFYLPINMKVFWEVISGLLDITQPQQSSTCCLWTLQYIWPSRTSDLRTKRSHPLLNFIPTLPPIRCSHATIFHAVCAVTNKLP